MLIQVWNHLDFIPLKKDVFKLTLLQVNKIKEASASFFIYSKSIDSACLMTFDFPDL